MRSKPPSTDIPVEDYKEQFLVLRKDEGRIWKNTTVAVVVPIHLTSKSSLLQVRTTLECLATQTILPVVAVVVDDASPLAYEFDEICPSSFMNIAYEKLEVSVDLSSAQKGFNLLYHIQKVIGGPEYFEPYMKAHVQEFA
ncbi:3175_t:CDS:2, partial [Acaulospora colombiana]